MLFKVDTAVREPLHEQITFQIRRAISKRELEPGDRLPAARQLAESLDVNMHTVLRSYQTLRDEGILEMRRGRGVSVAQTAKRTNRLRELAKEIEVEARLQGLNQAEVVALVKEYVQ